MSCEIHLYELYFHFSGVKRTFDRRFDNLSRECIIMEKTWEDVEWQCEEPLKEWYVEYIAVVNDEQFHHMSVLYGEDYSDVQRSLLHEVRRSYTVDDRIDVTIIKIHETNHKTDTTLFEGMFVP